MPEGSCAWQFGIAGFAGSAPSSWGDCWIVVAAVLWSNNLQSPLNSTIVACGSRVLGAVCDIGTDADWFISCRTFERPGLWRVELVDRSTEEEHRFLPVALCAVTPAEVAQLFQLESP